MVLRNLFIGLLALLLLFVQACSGSGQASTGEVDRAEVAQIAPLTLPSVSAALPDGSRLRVVATTSIIGDIVQEVAGDKADVTVLMEPGQDPHSYEPAASDLADVAQAHIVFIGGWNLEEGLLDDLANIAGEVPLVPVSAGVEPLALTGTASDVDQDFRIDPHTWLDPHNALRWVENIVQVLGTLDPANASTYRSKGDDYRQDLDLLITYYDEQITAIPDTKRKLITNHDSLGYFAARYGFTVFGTVIPGTSTVAEPSAADLTSLVELMQAHDICTVFTESTASDRLANAVTKELHDCGQVRVISLYSGALGPAGSGAETYLDMMRYNINAIRAGSDS